MLLLLRNTFFKMKFSFSIILLLLVTLNCFSQNDHKYVKLTEQKKGKRVTLYAQNTDSIPYDIFLKVETKDFRRSSNRPVLRTIPPESKVKLLTLIQLTGSEGQYNSIFVVNEVAYKLEIFKDKEALEFKLDNAINNVKVDLFTKNDCSICPNAKTILNRNKIKFTEYNIDQDSTHYNNIIKAFKTKKGDNTLNHIPVLKVKDKVYNNIKTLKDFVEALKEAFN